MGPLNLDANDYTAVAVGQLANNDVEVIALVDDRAGINPADLRIQVTHAASTVGAVDVINVTDVGAGAGTELLTGVTYKASDVLDLPAGVDYVIGLDTDGDDVANLTYTLPLGSVLASAVPAGSFVNAYANEGSSTVDITVQLDNGTMVTVGPNP